MDEFYNPPDLLYFMEWKEALIDALNGGVFRKDAWEDFIDEATRKGALSMAKDMTDRYNHYLGGRNE